MGWLKLDARRAMYPPAAESGPEDLKSTIQHVENIALEAPLSQVYKFAPIYIRDAELPFIPATEVSKRKSLADGGLFIVVDDIVYDCTQFISEHPGGEQIIKSFAGGECSWQFWRFHGKREMEQFGKPLRVGQTRGLVNKFKEPSRYVGLRSLGDN